MNIKKAKKDLICVHGKWRYRTESERKKMLKEKPDKKLYMLTLAL